jgi:hypothetical protein
MPQNAFSMYKIAILGLLFLIQVLAAQDPKGACINCPWMSLFFGSSLTAKYRLFQAKAIL